MLLATCSNQAEKSNNATFVTYLGSDTLAVEQFEKTKDGITARVVLRSPRTTLSSYNIILSEQESI